MTNLISYLSGWFYALMRAVIFCLKEVLTLHNNFTSSSLYLILFGMGARELQVLRIAYGSSHQRCYQEGRCFWLMFHQQFAVWFYPFLGLFYLGLAHGPEVMELGLSCQEKCMSWLDCLPIYGKGPMTALSLSQTTHRYVCFQLPPSPEIKVKMLRSHN